jgi:hypothetical protein
MNKRFGDMAMATAAAALLAAGGAAETFHLDPIGALEHRPLIDIRQPELPVNIGNVALNTVEISVEMATVNYSDPTGADLGARTNSKVGSGAVINYRGSKVIVTANHVESGVDDHCADQQIGYPASHGIKVFTTTVSATSPAPKNGNSDKFFHGADSSVLIPPLDQNLPAYPGLAVQDTIDVKVGEKVFSLGYGPRDNVDPNPLSAEVRLQPPAIIPGTVVRVKDGTASFITNIGGYGPLNDIEVEHGDSGGPVVDSKGEYLGNVITRTDANESIGDIEQEYHVNLPNGNPDRTFKVATVQLVDAQRLAEMFNATHDCDMQAAITQEVAIGTDVNALPMPSS